MTATSVTTGNYYFSFMQARRAGRFSMEKFDPTAV